MNERDRDDMVSVDGRSRKNLLPSDAKIEIGYFKVQVLETRHRREWQKQTKS